MGLLCKKNDSFHSFLDYTRKVSQVARGPLRCKPAY
jgi:hypothetical protein